MDSSHVPQLSGFGGGTVLWCQSQDGEYNLDVRRKLGVKPISLAVMIFRREILKRSTPGIGSRMMEHSNPVFTVTPLCHAAV